jgi:hypothetical protein
MRYQYRLELPQQRGLAAAGRPDEYDEFTLSRLKSSGHPKPSLSVRDM